MNNEIKQEINYVCYEINRRIVQMTYNQESHIREFLESCTYADDRFLTITEDETDYIASVLNVNASCVYDMFVDLGNIEEEEIDEDDEAFWDEQSRADDYNDERREGI